MNYKYYYFLNENGYENARVNPKIKVLFQISLFEPNDL